ncbi:MAG: hypothetical protein IPN69_04980 [Acidobacteria bacterium]|nr:hypothetical protein [Acidobacteriota bacterium]
MPKVSESIIVRRCRIALAAIALGLAVSAQANAQIIGHETIFDRYRQFVWQDQHGLPQNGISAIVQTPDGYLWLAIAEGVARFDGVRFTAFDTGNTTEIKSNNVQALHVSRDGTLWIGTHGGGLTTFRDGVFRNYSTNDGLSDSHIKCIFEDSRGEIWIGTDGGGLNRFSNNRFVPLTTADGLPDNFVNAIGEDGSGKILIGTNRGLVKFDDGKLTVLAADDQIEAIFVDRAGRIWFGGASGLRQIKVDGTIRIFDDADGFGSEEVLSIASDPDGAIFVGTAGGGLYRYIWNSFQAVSTKSGLIDDEIQALFTGESGDVWLGTNGGGLVLLRRPQIEVMTKAEGLPDEMVSAVFADSSGAIWIGTEGGLARFEGDRIASVKGPNGEDLRGINSISQNPDGSLWLLSHSRGFRSMKVRYDGLTGRLVTVRSPVTGKSMAASITDRNGRFWYANPYEGLTVIASDGTQQSFRKPDGLADDYVTALFESSDGTVWIGTRNGLSRFYDGRITTPTAADGFNARHILSFREDVRGNIWIGTHGDGLYRFRDGKFASVSSKDGLYDNLAFQILEDAAGNLWMSGNKGIYRVRIDELEGFLEGKRKSVDSFAYGSADGMFSRECNGANPAGARGPDGRLWFPTIKGVAVVDPARLGKTPPSIMIEQIMIDDKPIPFGSSPELGPGQENLEIRFSAISWNRPNQVRFRYKLDGLDADWFDAGTRRTAFYPHIAPGNYTFHVIADNGEGVWSEEGRTIAVRVLPPYYKTWVFYALCVLAIFAVAWLIYRYRLSQLRKINEFQEAFTLQLIDYQEQERKRIAVELHDSIGQSLIVIRNRALMSLNSPDNHERVLEQLSEISDSAADSINEVRQIAHNLHPYQLEHLGLKTALETMIEQAEKASDIHFMTEIDNVDETLTKENEINLYRVVQESLNNILKHSGAREAEIRIFRNNGNLHLSIKDDGRGFVVGYEAGIRGLGLAGIAERAKMLNAEYEIRSTEGKGTTVSLVVDLKK